MFREENKNVIYMVESCQYRLRCAKRTVETPWQAFVAGLITSVKSSAGRYEL
jgi:hypothetical protein